MVFAFALRRVDAVFVALEHKVWVAQQRPLIADEGRIGPGLIGSVDANILLGRLK